MSLCVSTVNSMPIFSASAGMTQAQKSLEKSAQSIASGIKLNINPADSYVASGLNTDIRAAKKAAENAQTGFNVMSVADSIVSNITNSLGRIQELSIQAANGLYSDEQRAVMQNEINQNTEHIQKTFANATFNGKTVLNSVTQDNPDAVPVLDFFTGSESSSVISFDPNIVTSDFKFDVSSPEAASDSLAKINAIMNDLNAKRAEIGSVQTDFEGAINQQITGIMSSSAALSDIQDTDYLSAIVDMKKSAFSMETMSKVMKTVMNADKYVLNLLE